jgi:hypothetical protein
MRKAIAAWTKTAPDAVEQVSPIAHTSTADMPLVVPFLSGGADRFTFSRSDYDSTESHVQAVTEILTQAAFESVRVRGNFLKSTCPTQYARLSDEVFQEAVRLTQPFRDYLPRLAIRNGQAFVDFCLSVDGTLAPEFDEWDRKINVEEDDSQEIDQKVKPQAPGILQIPYHSGPANFSASMDFAMQGLWATSIATARRNIGTRFLKELGFKPDAEVTCLQEQGNGKEPLKVKLSLHDFFSSCLEGQAAHRAAHFWKIAFDMRHVGKLISGVYDAIDPRILSLTGALSTRLSWRAYGTVKKHAEEVIPLIESEGGLFALTCPIELLSLGENVKATPEHLDHISRLRKNLAAGLTHEAKTRLVARAPRYLINIVNRASHAVQRDIEEAIEEANDSGNLVCADNLRMRATPEYRGQILARFFNASRMAGGEDLPSFTLLGTSIFHGTLLGIQNEENKRADFTLSEKPDNGLRDAINLWLAVEQLHEKRFTYKAILRSLYSRGSHDCSASPGQIADHLLRTSLAPGRQSGNRSASTTHATWVRPTKAVLQHLPDSIPVVNPNGVAERWVLNILERGGNRPQMKYVHPDGTAQYEFQIRCHTMSPAEIAAPSSNTPSPKTSNKNGAKRMTDVLSFPLPTKIPKNGAPLLLMGSDPTPISALLEKAEVSSDAALPCRDSVQRLSEILDRCGVAYLSTSLDMNVAASGYKSKAVAAQQVGMQLLPEITRGIANLISQDPLAALSLTVTASKGHELYLEAVLGTKPISMGKARSYIRILSEINDPRGIRRVLMHCPSPFAIDRAGRSLLDIIVARGSSESVSVALDGFAKLAGESREMLTNYVSRSVDLALETRSSEKVTRLIEIGAAFEVYQAKAYSDWHPEFQSDRCKNAIDAALVRADMQRMLGLVSSGSKANLSSTTGQAPSPFALPG